MSRFLGRFGHHPLIKAKYFSHTAEEKNREVGGACVLASLIEAFTNLASNQELACIYAALALQQDDGVPILAEKLQAMVEVAGVSVEPFWAGLYAKGLQGVDVKALIYNIGSGVGSAPAAAAVVTASSAGGGAAAPAAVNEEKKNEESKEELDDDMGFGLFD
uniref:Large ribosomal subunit protein P1 n=1 Tax=Globodera pallida TaxID=36090 RepID=A0A183C080_GLOPA